MGEIVPKKKARRDGGEHDPTASASEVAGNVTPIRRPRHAGGRVDSTTYDPATGREATAKGYRASATRESGLESDVFTLVDDRGYREDRFYCRSVNADGHGEKLSLRVPQGIDSQMHAAVAEVPEYRTMHDLVRDAVIHRLEYLQKRYNLGDGARRMLELERISANMEQRTQETETMQAAVENLEGKLQRLYDQRDWSMIVEQFEMGSELLDWLRDPYRGRAAEILGKWKATCRESIRKMVETRED